MMGLVFGLSLQGLLATSGIIAIALGLALEDVAQGLPMAERKLALAVQGQSYGPMFDEKLTIAAWKLLPETMRSVITGGSLGGLVAGLELRAAGLPVSIHERSEHVLDDRGSTNFTLPNPNKSSCWTSWNPPAFRIPNYLSTCISHEGTP
jgi:hypothetical protein